jgi:hypothetical protein
MSNLLGYSYTDEMIDFIHDCRVAGLSYPEIAEQFNEQFADNIPRPKSPENLRVTYLKYQDMNYKKDPEIDVVKRLHRTKNTSSKNAKENRLLLNEITKYEDFVEVYRDIEARCPIKFHKKVKLRKPREFKSTIVAHISDTHIGVNIDEKVMDGFNRFNPEVAARRFALLFREIGEYKKHRRKTQDLVLVLNGDIIAGVIHDQEHVQLAATQLSQARRILIQGISYLASKFSNIRVICTTGNHDRYIHKSNKGRQSSAKWDSFGTNIYTSLRDAFKLAKYKNVQFEIPE